MTAGISLVIQWLRLNTPSKGGPSSISGQETRSRVPQLKEPTQCKEDPACGNEEPESHRLRPSAAKYIFKRLEIIKFLEENMGRTFFDINHSNI